MAVSGVPTHREALDLARALLGDEGTRLAHVRTAGVVAQRLGVLFDQTEAALLVAAATLHDIGYSPRIAHRGFHPLDGALFLQAEGYPDRLAALVAHHSLAHMTAGPAQVAELEAAFPREESLLADALAYADMHSAPDGRFVGTEVRLAGIAARHRDRGEADRAVRLRAAITRVGAALLATQAGGLPQPRAGGATPAPRMPARVGPARVSAAFEAWWSTETQYRLAWTEFAEDRSPHDPPTREHVLHLARLRGIADRRRDQYFRLALG